MIANKYSPDNYKSLKISIGEITKNSGIQERFIPNQLKTEKLCTNTVKKLTLMIRNVPD